MAMTEPTERSMPPMSIAIVRPQARTMFTVICLAMLNRLLGARNFSETPGMTESSTNISAKAPKTPRSSLIPLNFPPSRAFFVFCVWQNAQYF